MKPLTTDSLLNKQSLRAHDFNDTAMKFISRLDSRCESVAGICFLNKNIQ